MLDFEPKPYIGVTGFTTPEQVQSALDTVPDNSFRNLMVGILVNWRSIRWATEESSNNRRFPSVDVLQSLFLSHERALNLVHFNTNGEYKDEILYDLLRIHDLVGENLHGFQLNIAWPDVNVIQRYRRAEGNVKIVLQIGGGAFNQAGNTPEGLANKLYPYIDVVDYVLLDKSGGTGKALDGEVLKPYISAIKERHWGLGIGVAGGLGPNSLDLVDSIMEKYPTTSIDAEGLVRTEENELDIETTREYLRKSFSKFGQLV